MMRGRPRWVAAGRSRINETHGAAPAPYRALELIELSRAAPLTDGLAAERRGPGGTRRAPSNSGPVSTRSTWCRSGPAHRPAPQTQRWPPRDQGRHHRRRPDGRAIALLFARNLQVPIVMTDIDQTRLDKGVAAVHSEITALAGKKRITPEQATRLTAFDHRFARLRRIHRRRIHHRSRFRGNRYQEEGVRRTGEACQPACGAGIQHLFTVDHCDGRKPWSTRKELSDFISSTLWRSCRYWRSSAWIKHR